MVFTVHRSRRWPYTRTPVILRVLFALGISPTPSLQSARTAPAIAFSDIASAENPAFSLSDPKIKKEEIC